MRSAIYQGDVLHRRLKPKEHVFSYPVYFYRIDLSELGTLDREVAGFGYNRWQPVALHDKDFLSGDDTSVEQRIRERLSGAGLEAGVETIELVTALRYFGYVFNPVSFYLCYGAEDQLTAVVAEVNNTFGDRHLYLVPELKAEAGGYRATRLQRKQFHVSPFNDMNGDYEFIFTGSGDTLDIRVNLQKEGEAVLTARLHGTGRPLTSANLRRTLLRYPLTALLTMPRIVAQAARLYFSKKLKVFTRPEPAHPNTVLRKPPGRVERFAMHTILRLFGRIARGRLNVELPDGTTRTLGLAGTGPEQTLSVKRYRFFTRLLFSGDIGFGEAYVQGDFECDDLPGLIELLGRNRDIFPSDNLWLARLGAVRDAVLHLFRSNTRSMSRRNIYEHYDLSNAFFGSFLDPTMTYSCALYRSPNESLEQAQRNKLAALIQKAEINSDCHVLEIGSGWGSFAMEAARTTGCRVTSVTISQEQYELAVKRVSEAGLSDRVKIRLCDYRDLKGQFDRVVSVEMLEAVGHRYLGTFFRQVGRLLKPDGIAVLQVITYPDRNYEAYRKSSDWIRKHIFPGGHLPSLTAISSAMTRNSDLVVQSVDNIGPHYAATLRAWRTRFMDYRATEGPAADQEFRRKWLYYLSYCEAGFALRYINTLHLVLARPGTTLQGNSTTAPGMAKDKWAAKRGEGYSHDAGSRI